MNIDFWTVAYVRGSLYSSADATPQSPGMSSPASARDLHQSWRRSLVAKSKALQALITALSMIVVTPLQAEGNKAFTSGNFEEAIKHYSAGIEVDATNHVLFSNRSACQVLPLLDLQFGLCCTAKESVGT